MIVEINNSTKQETRTKTMAIRPKAQVNLTKLVTNKYYMVFINKKLLT